MAHTPTELHQSHGINYTIEPKVCQISSKTSNFRIKVGKVGNVQMVYWHRFLLKYMRAKPNIGN